MEFSYKNYLVRFVRNATDSILRLEETTTHKLYETTLYERDVLEYSALGGIEFVSGIIADGLKTSVEADDDDEEEEEGSGYEGNVATVLTVEKEALTLTFTYHAKFVSKPLVISLTLPAVRRIAAAEDSEAMARRIRELEGKMGKLLDYVAALEDRVGFVAIGGNGPPCPIDATSVVVSVSNQANSYYYNNRWGKDYFHLSIYSGTGTEGIASLKGFQYLTKCTTLVIGGCHPSLKDFSALGFMTSLQSLTIMCDTDGSGLNQGGCNGAKPQLRDISWISKLVNLRTLNFHGCEHLADLTPLKPLRNLTSLRISQTAVTNTDWLSVSKPKCVITK